MSTKNTILKRWIYSGRVGLFALFLIFSCANVSARPAQIRDVKALDLIEDLDHGSDACAKDIGVLTHPENFLQHASNLGKGASSLNTPGQIGNQFAQSSDEEKTVRLSSPIEVNMEDLVKQAGQMPSRFLASASQQTKVADQNSNAESSDQSVNKSEEEGFIDPGHIVDTVTAQAQDESANTGTSDRDSEQVSDTLYHTKVRVSMISDYKSVNPGQEFWLGLILQMPEGWHIYWQNPGDDSGMATTVTWHLPEGFKIEPAAWPVPQRIEDGESISYGYVGGETPILAKIIPDKTLETNKTYHFGATIDWIECEKYCSPGQANLKTSVAVTKGDPEWNIPGRFIISKAQGDSPLPLPKGWKSVAFRYPNKQIKLCISSPEGMLNPAVNHFYFYPFDDSVPTNSPQNCHRLGDTLILDLNENAKREVERLKGLIYAPDFWMPGSTLTAMVVNTPVVVPDLATVESLEDPTSRASRTISGLSRFAALGFLGGLLLNLMPCVFPVLGIRLVGLVKQANQSRTQICIHGLIFTLGVLVSFWCLAFILTLLRGAGQQIGWGFQLQYPGFVFFLVVLMFIFGLSLGGLFEIGQSFSKIADKLGNNSGYIGSFLTGVLETVVATPCSAPFLAPALGAALMIPFMPSLVVFTAVGLGLSSPYLVLCVFPSWVQKLPKPGPWMEIFKQVMAFCFYLTVCYLIWVIAGQVSSDLFMRVLAGLVIITFAAWLYGLVVRSNFTARTRHIIQVLAVVIFVTGYWLGMPIERKNSLNWEPWSVDLVEQYRKENRPVWIDFTARWCLICQANKQAYDDPDVIRLIKKKNVALLEADWTTRDAKITAALNEYGAPAVPLALLYRPGHDAATVQPRVLLPSIVLSALKELPDPEEVASPEKEEE